MHDHQHRTVTPRLDEHGARGSVMPRAALYIGGVAALVGARVAIGLFHVVPAVRGQGWPNRVPYWVGYALVWLLLPAGLLWLTRRLLMPTGATRTLFRVAVLALAGAVYHYLAEMASYGPFVPTARDLLAFSMWTIPLAVLIGGTRRDRPRGGADVPPIG